MSETTTSTTKSGMTIGFANIVWLLVGLLAWATLIDIKKTTMHEIESVRSISTKNQVLLKHIAAGQKLTPHEIRQIDRFGDIVE